MKILILLIFILTSNNNLLKKANPNQLGLTSIAWHFGGGSDAYFTACATERNICMATGGNQCFLEYFACTDDCIIVWN